LAPGEPLSEAEVGSLGYAVINDNLSRSNTPRDDLLRLWEKLRPETGVLALGLLMDQGPAPADIVQWLREQGTVTVCEQGTFNGCHMLVLRKAPEPEQLPHAAAAQRALVFRPGGYGDGLCAASVFPGLRKQGYDVTFLTLLQAGEIVRNNPYVYRILSYGINRLPATELTPMLLVQASQYDKFINLNESYEHAVLAVPGRTEFDWPASARRRRSARMNVEELAALIAEVPYIPGSMWFYPTDAERQSAADLKRQILDVAGSGASEILVWALAGSADHKWYPHTAVVLAQVMQAHPDLVVCLAGGPAERDRMAATAVIKQLVDALGPEHTASRLVDLHATGASIRTVYALAQDVDVVAGPETGIHNAVAHTHVAQVILLSHSTVDNLPRDWTNTTAVVPTCDEYPCGRMHIQGMDCPLDPATGASKCPSSIPPQSVIAAVLEKLTKTAGALAAD